MVAVKRVLSEVSFPPVLVYIDSASLSKNDKKLRAVGSLPLLPPAIIMKKLMVFGAFDGLHPGHLDFFKQAKRYGDFLIVSVGTDKNVKAIKGKDPLFNQKERLALVASVGLIDKAVLGSERDFYRQIKKYAPDVICLGYDQWATEDDVRMELYRVGLKKTKVVRLKPYKTSKAKSTIVKKNSVDW